MISHSCKSLLPEVALDSLLLLESSNLSEKLLSVKLLSVRLTRSNMNG